jgi:hypothetical protein
MKYKGKIGEFSFWWLGVALCAAFVIAFAIYSQFSFVAPSNVTAPNPPPDQSAIRVKEIESQVRDLDGRVLNLQKKVTALESASSQPKAKAKVSSSTKKD